MTEQQKRMAARYHLNEQQSRAKALSQSDLEQKSTEQTLEASVQ